MRCASRVHVAGKLELPIARRPLDQVRDAFRELADRHTQGKIVLVPWTKLAGSNPS
jgi:hypothetical protein